MANKLISELPAGTAVGTSVVPVADASGNTTKVTLADIAGLAGSGSGLIADNAVTTAKLQNGAVTYAKIQNVSATDRLLGRASAGAGAVEEIPCTAAGRSLLASADAAAMRAYLQLAASVLSNQYGQFGFGAAPIISSGARIYATNTVNYPPSSNQFSGEASAGFFEQNFALSDVNNSVVSGLRVTTLRNNGALLDVGTQRYLRGVDVAYGHNLNNAGATPATTNAVGLFVQAYRGVGTIETAVDLYLAPDALTPTWTPAGSGTITNRWGIWQAEPSANNYFAGRLGINTQLPTSALDVNGVITVAAGTAAAPAVVPSGNANTGLYFPAANTVALSANGVERFRVDATGLTTFSSPIAFANGTAASPSVAPAGNANTGLYFPAANTAAISTNGVERLRVTATGATQVADFTATGATQVASLTATGAFTVSGATQLANLTATGTAAITDLSITTSMRGAIPLSTVEGRLTLRSLTPVPATSVTSSTLYYTPATGNKIVLNSATGFRLYTFSELTLSLSALAANTNHDIFVYDDNGTLRLAASPWQNDTTRGTASPLRWLGGAGMVVSHSAPFRRFVGTIRTLSTGGCTDSSTQRFVWNMHNRVPRRLSVAYTTAHTYAGTTGTYRPWNNITTSGITRVEFVSGFPSVLVNDAGTELAAANSDTGMSVSFSAILNNGWATIGANSTTAAASDGLVVTNASTANISVGAQQMLYPVAGYWYLQMLQGGITGTTSSFSRFFASADPLC